MSRLSSIESAHRHLLMAAEELLHAGRKGLSNRAHTLAHALRKSVHTGIRHDPTSLRDIVGPKPINRRLKVRHFSHSADKTGRVRYYVSYTGPRGIPGGSHEITREEMERYYQRRAR